MSEFVVNGKKIDMTSFPAFEKVVAHAKDCPTCKTGDATCAKGEKLWADYQAIDKKGKA